MRKYYQRKDPGPLPHVRLLPIFSRMKSGEIKTKQNKEEIKGVGTPQGFLKTKEDYQGISSLRIKHARMLVTSELICRMGPNINQSAHFVPL